MAYTQLSPMALPGSRYSFVAKTESAVISAFIVHSFVRIKTIVDFIRPKTIVDFIRPKTIVDFIRGII